MDKVRECPFLKIGSEFPKMGICYWASKDTDILCIR